MACFFIKFQIEEAWTYRVGSLAFAVTKGLPYEMFMKKVIREISEKGQLHKLRQQWITPHPYCGELNENVTPLSLQKLLSLFIICIIGISIALVTLFIEKIFVALQLNVEKPSHESIKKKENKIKLGKFLNEIKVTLENDCVMIQETTVTALNQEIENYNKMI